MVDDSFSLLTLVYGAAFVAGIGVSIAFLWVALAKVRPHNEAAGSLMATGVGISLALRIAQPVFSVVMGRTLDAEDFARTLGLINAGSALIGAVGAAMVVASVAMLVSKPGARG